MSCRHLVSQYKGSMKNEAQFEGTRSLAHSTRSIPQIERITKNAIGASATTRLAQRRLEIPNTSFRLPEFCMALLDRLFNQSTNLSSSQRKFWDEHGYLVLKGVLKPKEIRAYLDELDSLWKTGNTMTTP